MNRAQRRARGRRARRRRPDIALLPRGAPEQLVTDVARASALARGCSCTPTIDPGRAGALHRVAIAHDAWCPALGHGPGAN